MLHQLVITARIWTTNLTQEGPDWGLFFMQYWILKTEPSTYSIDDLKKDKKTAWDGVRNFQARNNLSKMKPKDCCLIYHSVGPKEIVGMAFVVKEAYPDKTSADPRWVCVDVAFDRMLPSPVHLEQLKAHQQLCDLSLVRQGRLSVCPISKEEFNAIMKLASF